MASQASARRAVTAALRHAEMGAHERKYLSCEVRIHSFHGRKGTPPSITRTWERREDDGRSGHGHRRLREEPMKMQARMPAIILMAVGVAAPGSWRLSATSKQAHETGENTRVAISQTLPRMDGGHLEAKAIEVTYQPGASSPAHSHPCPVLANVAEGTIRSQVNDEPERVYKVGE